MNRRNFLKQAAAGTGVAALAACTSLKKGNAMHQLPKIGVQLYSVRSLMEKSVPRTLEQIAQLGYKEVEFAGYFNNKAEEVRRLLDANGLTSPSAHVSPEILTDSTMLNQALDDASKIGHKYLTIAWLPENMRTPENFKRLTEGMNQTGELCKQRGIQMAYHNHDFEFKAMPDGKLPYDMLLDGTDKNLVKFEMDLYWINKAGFDPLAYFQKHSGRFTMCHVKDMLPDGNMCEVGKGKLNFGSYFAQSELAGLKHYFVEHDNPTDALASVTTSANYLKTFQF
jgi:sugar phosphate isomerase/epimerase